MYKAVSITVSLAAMAAIVLAAPAGAFGQRNMPLGDDWPRFAGDLAGTRYSPLTDITPENVSTLETAWTYGVAGGGGRGGRGRGAAPDPDAPAQIGAATPIVVDGVMYVSGGANVVAIEAETGREIWRRTIEDGNPSPRGVAYWPGNGAAGPRVIFMAGSRIIGLDAATGEPVPRFGGDGIVELTVPYNGVPTIINDTVVIGAYNAELSDDGPDGDTRAFDAVSGDLMWTFDTIVKPGDPNFEGAWLDDGWSQDRSGVNHWGWYMTADEERGIVYMALGSPAGNYWGGDRPGTNLYGNSVVAVEADSGRYLWHFQTVHHDLWDSDQPTSPVLVDIEQNGEMVPALALIGKTSYMFILNRVTGEPIFGVEERPVPPGNAPDEWYSPTQPFPVAPPPLARVTFSRDDLVTAEDTTPEHAQACLDLWERAGGFRNLGPFTGWNYQDLDEPPQTNIQFPGNGGTNWGGPAADPDLGYVIAFTQDAGFTGWIEEKREDGNYGTGNGSPQPYDRGSITGSGPYSGFAQMGMPCQKPPWGRLTAVNASTGEFAWQVVLGVSDDLPEGRQNTGRGGSAGPITTAGGLTFIGATSDARFRAIDTRTGSELWVTRMPGNASANPLTYRGRDGRQYVAITAAGQVHAFALPD